MPVNNRGRRSGRLSAFGYLLTSSSVLAIGAQLTIGIAAAQTAPPSGQPSTGQTPNGQTPSEQTTSGRSKLPPISVRGRLPKQPKTTRKRGRPTPLVPSVRTNRPPPSAPGPSTGQPGQAPPSGLAGIPMTPLPAVAPSSSRLNLHVLETPASVDIVTQQTMQD